MNRSYGLHNKFCVIWMQPFFCDFMVTSLHEANGKSLFIFQTVLCQNNFRLSFNSYERFILAHTAHSSMTRFLVLKNQPHDIHCVLIFYFCLFFIDVSILFFDILSRQKLVHATNCYIFVTFPSTNYYIFVILPFSFCMPLIATFSSHFLPLITTFLSYYLSVSACH